MIIKYQVDIKATEAVKAKLTFEREAHSQGVVVKGYHTDNGVFNASEFMEELLKNQQKIRFSGAGSSHQNGAAECAIKTVVTMKMTMLMHAALRCTYEKLSTEFGQWECIMLYVSTIRSLICSLDYPLLKYGQDQGLSQCQKPLATDMFGVVQHIF